MRLVWILNGCGLESGTVTGSPLRFHAVSRRWQDKAEVEQSLVTTPGGAEMLRRMGSTVPVSRLLPASLVLRREPFVPFRFWSYVVTSLAALTRPWRLPDADALITVSDYFCDIVPALRIKRRNPKACWVAWVHHRELPPGARPGRAWINQITWRMQAWSLRRIARHADAAWVYDTEAGDAVRDELVRHGMDAARVQRMRCGIEAADAVVTDASAKTTDAVMVGVRPNKGLHDIVPVWSEVVRRRPGTTLRLMGGITGAAELESALRQHGLADVVTLFRPEKGWLDTPAYYRALSQARVLFAPSREEGWGIALCEAMACGVPVVAWDLPVYRRIYGDAFLGITPGDHAAMAEAICRVLDDATAAAPLHAAGLTCAARYDWTAVASEDWERLSQAQQAGVV
jgi:glycosyltransferase involved in cell wall biosynthesis